MALREANYVFSRRISNRGNDKIMFDSQDRKIQETDSKDVIWDEIVGKEEHPEFYDGYKFLETDPEAFIRDENCGKEEYPGNCSVIYPSPPCFDEYEDEEWYSWFTSGDRNLPGYKFCDVEGDTVVVNGGIAAAQTRKVMDNDGVDKIVGNGRAISLADPKILPVNVERLNFSDDTKAYPTKLKFQNMDKSGIDLTVTKRIPVFL